MQENFVEKYFINSAIEYGIRSYLLDKEGLKFERIHTFEMHVIKTLTIIYGEKSILLPYKIDNETAFKCNLLMYGLKESELDQFIKYMDEYYNFMHNYKSERKATGLMNEIETILLSMITKRSKKYQFTQEELNAFDSIFNPSNGELKQLKQLISSNQGLIVREWANQRNEISNTQIRLRAVNPSLLDPNVYFKYGYDIKTIAELSDKEIDDVNNTIICEENKLYKIKHDVKIKNKLVLSTGYALLDLLLVLSVIATLSMVGIIMFSTFWG